MSNLRLGTNTQPDPFLIMSERDLIIHQLHKIHGTKTKSELMHELYYRNLCSDLCLCLDDIATLDLLRAYNAGLREAQ